MSRLHDAVARHYNSDDRIIEAKNRIVFEALVTRFSDRAVPLRVVDLGVGDGSLLELLQRLRSPLAMTGLDVSAAMLRRATERVPLTAVLASAEEAAAHLPLGAFDLVLAHFILAYVRPQVLLEQVRALLAPGGVLSLAATTTEGGAPYYAALDTYFRSRRHPLKRLIGWAADRALANSHMPADGAELQLRIESARLRVLSRQTLRMPFEFDSPEAAYRFGIEDGWAVNILSIPGVPLSVAKAVARYGLRQCEYPFKVTQVIEIFEASPADGSAD